MPKRERKKIAGRTGKRIDAARELFGGIEGEGTLIMRKREKETDPLEKLLARPSKERDMENQLSLSALKGEVASSLIELYLKASYKRVMLLEGSQFRQAFETANRRIEEMDVQSQVLAHVLIAVASRFSDHPLLIGSSAPLLSSIPQAAKDGKDLSEYGAARENKCQLLLEGAVRLVDEKGTMRVPSVESITSLMLLEGLIDEHSPDTNLDTRAYSSAYNNHAKTLLADESPSALRDRISKTMLGWTAMVRDAMSSGALGRSPLYSEDDIILLLADRPKPMTLDVVLALPRGENRQKSFWTLFHSILQHITENSRETSAKLTGPGARRRLKLDLDFCDLYLRRLDLAVHGFEELLIRAKVLAQSEVLHLDPESPMIQELPLDLASIVRAVQMTRCTQAFLLKRIIAQRTGRGIQLDNMTWPALPGPPPEMDDEGYWTALEGLKERADERCFGAAREIAAMFKETIEAGIPVGTGQWQDGRGTQMLFNRINIWVGILLSEPVIEEGGRYPAWDYTSKIHDLRWYHKAVLSVGWAFAKLAKHARWLDGEIRKTEEGQTQYYLGLADAFTTTSGNGNGSGEFGLNMGLGELDPMMGMGFGEMGLGQTLEELMDTLGSGQGGMMGFSNGNDGQYYSNGVL